MGDVSKQNYQEYILISQYDFKDIGACRKEGRSLRNDLRSDVEIARSEEDPTEANEVKSKDGGKDANA